MKQSTRICLLLAGLSLLTAPAGAQRRKQAEKKPAARQAKPQPKKTTPVKQAPVTVSRTAGDTVIRSTTLEVYQVYKPEIKPAPKPEFTPTLPPVDAQRIVQQYEVPQQALYYTYRSLPLKPLALGKDTTTLPPANYVKVGGGNLSTIYADAGIGSLHGEDWDAAIHLHHISQSGDRTGQKFWHTGLDANGSLHADDHLWTGGLDLNYRRFGLYGYDHSQFTYDESDLRRNYFGAGLQVGVQNEGAGLWGLDYRPVIKAGYYSSNAIDGEQTVDINVPVSKKIDSSLSVEMGVHGIFTHLKSADFSEGNNIVQLTPGITFHKDRFSGHLGLYPTFAKYGNTHLLPDITASYLVSNYFKAKAGWQAQMLQNTFQQLTLKNPFLYGIQEIRQSRTDEVFASFESSIGKHFSLSGRFSWWQYNTLPIYMTSAFSDGKSFVVAYEPNVNAVSLQVAARYQVAEEFSLGVSGAWYSYYNEKNNKVYQEPAVRLKGDMQWHILKDLQFNAYLSVMDEMYARNAIGEEVKMNGVLDLGAGAEYQLIPRLSLWLNVGNLLNRKNERWLGYQTFGINIFGGVRFNF